MSCCRRKKNKSEKVLMKPRKCTDVMCLSIYVLFWCFLIFIASFALIYGDPMRLVNGYDYHGNVCGQKNTPLLSTPYSGMDMTDKHYVFFFDPSNMGSSFRTCVSVCPSRKLNTLDEVLAFQEEVGSMLCWYDIATHNQTDNELESHRLCPVLPVRKSIPVLNRCIPDDSDELVSDIVYEMFAFLNTKDTFEQMITDLYSSWKEILGLCALSVVLSFICILFLYLLVNIVSAIFMVTVSLAALFLTSMLWWTYADLKLELDKTPFNRLLEQAARNEHAFLILSVIVTIITVILLLVIFAMRKRVHLAASLFKEAGSCLSDMPSLFLQPLVTFIALALFFAFWIVVMISLATADNANIHTMHPATNSVLALDSWESISITNIPGVFFMMEYVDPTWVHHFWWVYIIALVWVSEFILSCQQMVIAGAVAEWYFTRERGSITMFLAGWRSVWRLFCYHLGSVAMGSFFITLFKIPRLILTYIQTKLKQYEENRLASCCLTCCSCCLWCLERFIRYLNHNAYTIIAIEGNNFCTAARQAFNTLVNNALQVATINSVGDFVLFLGKCSVMIITGLVSVLVMKYNIQLHFYAVPVVVVSVFAFFIAHCMFSIYEMAIDTMFLCYCEDINHNDGTVGKEYFAPKSLHRFIERHVKVPRTAIFTGKPEEVEHLNMETSQL